MFNTINILVFSLFSLLPYLVFYKNINNYNFLEIRQTASS